MPRVISFARQRAKLGISGRTNARVVKRYRRAMPRRTVYRRAIGKRRVPQLGRLRGLIRARIMPAVRFAVGYRRRAAAAAARYSPQRYSPEAIAQLFSPRRSRSRYRPALAAPSPTSPAGRAQVLHQIASLLSGRK